MIMKKIISHKQPGVSSWHYAKKKYPQKWKVLGGRGGVGPVVCSAHTNVLTCVAEGHTQSQPGLALGAVQLLMIAVKL